MKSASSHRITLKIILVAKMLQEVRRKIVSELVVASRCLGVEHGRVIDKSQANVNMA
jgi:hypothetical protein